MKKNNAARQISSWRAAYGEASCRLGAVVGLVEGALTVRTDAGECDARRAASCLLEPEIDDLVMVATSSAGVSWVLAVLDRDETTTATLSMDGDVALRSRRGKLSLGAAEGLTFASAVIDVVAGALRAHAEESELVSERTSVISRALRGDLGVVKLVAESIETVVERWVQRSNRVLRLVRDADELRAGRIDHAADGSLTLRAEHAVVTAEGLIKMDADQIHLG